MKIWFGLALVLVLAAFGLWKLAKPGPDKSSASRPVQESTSTTSTSSSPDAPGNSSQNGRGSSTAALNHLQNARQSLGKQPVASRSRGALEELRKQLLSLPRDQASSAIQQFISSGVDSQTGMEFKVGKDGMLESAPTLRTFLLDMLLALDPGAASALAREILNRMDSPDEWALSLRNLAKAAAPGQSSAPLLEQKMHQLLNYEPWRKEPSTGFLEAFDVAVHLKSPKLLPDLAQLAKLTNNQAVAYAAYLATDRLVINNPVESLGLLLQESSLLAGREQSRAGFFARLDVSVPEQRELASRYLLDPNRSEAELSSFAETFPNENYMMSQNLVTKQDSRDGSKIRTRDVASLRVVEQWLQDDRFRPLRPHLLTMQRRLQVFLQSQK